jgi:hypothetical protein
VDEGLELRGRDQFFGGSEFEGIVDGCHPVSGVTAAVTKPFSQRTVGAIFTPKVTAG